jgi:transmembrane sensor
MGSKCQLYCPVSGWAGNTRLLWARMERKYETYDAAQFLDDPFFIEWVKNRTPESVAFWNEWINSNPFNLQAMQEAEVQLKALLSVEKVEIPEGDAEEVWRRIEASIQSHGRKGTPISILSVEKWYIRKTWWAAASILLLFSTLGYFALKTSFPDTNPNEAQNNTIAAQHDISPGGTRAFLTLADGTNLVLDSAANGALAKQGNVTIIKLDGQLAYNHAGEKAGEVLYNTITTPKGGQYQLILADGTKVWLNAASSIRFPTTFYGSQRRVELTGEAYFEVAHNPAAPFYVGSGTTEVMVLGTHFNIMAYSDEAATLVTLLQGSVSVQSTTHKTVIKPGQQARVATGISVADDVDTEQVMAWKNGAFVFGESMSIQEIMRQLSRWYDVEIVYQRQPTGRIGGSISKQVNISQVLSILEMTGEVHFELQGKSVIVK